MKWYLSMYFIIRSKVSIIRSNRVTSHLKIATGGRSYCLANSSNVSPRWYALWIRSECFRSFHPSLMILSTRSCLRRLSACSRSIWSPPSAWRVARKAEWETVVRGRMDVNNSLMLSSLPPSPLLTLLVALLLLPLLVVSWLVSSLLPSLQSSFGWSNAASHGTGTHSFAICRSRSTLSWEEDVNSPDRVNSMSFS